MGRDQGCPPGKWKLQVLILVLYLCSRGIELNWEKALKLSVRNRSYFSEVSRLFAPLWSKQPALFSATWYCFKARNREHPDQTCVAKMPLRGAGYRNLHRWRRKLRSILSHPGEESLLPNGYLENEGWDGGRCPGHFWKTCLRSHCPAWISETSTPHSVSACASPFGSPGKPGRKDKKSIVL